MILFFTFMTKNFAERQKSIVFAKRKIIILRRMLGIDYGTQEFLFKKGMLEGANMPFNIKLKVNYLYFIIPILCFVVLLVVNIFFRIFSKICSYFKYSNICRIVSILYLLYFRYKRNNVFSYF